MGKKETKKFMCLMLAVFLFLSSFGNLSINVNAENNSILYEEDGCQIEYRIGSSWEEAYNVSVTIRNTGDAPIEDWCMVFPLKEKIGSIWNRKL